MWEQGSHPTAIQTKADWNQIERTEVSPPGLLSLIGLAETIPGRDQLIDTLRSDVNNRRSFRGSVDQIDSKPAEYSRVGLIEPNMFGDNSVDGFAARRFLQNRLDWFRENKVVLISKGVL
jgi:hypothetical protein